MIEQQESRSDIVRIWLYTHVRREILQWSLAVFLLVNACITVGFVCAGCWQLFKALAIFVAEPSEHAAYGSPSIASMAMAIKAIELILLAPLSYVFLSALGNFISQLDEKDGDWREAFHAVVGVKSLAASLLASIVAVDLVGKVLQGVTLDVHTTLLQCLLLALLILFLIALDRGVAGD